MKKVSTVPEKKIGEKKKLFQMLPPENFFARKDTWDGWTL